MDWIVKSARNRVWPCTVALLVGRWQPFLFLFNLWRCSGGGRYLEHPRFAHPTGSRFAQ